MIFRDDADAQLFVRWAAEALGVNDSKGDAAEVLRHIIAQAALELEVVEELLERRNGATRDPLLHMVEGIRRRLSFADELSHEVSP